MLRFLRVVLAASLLAVFATPAFAQMVCGPRPSILSNLARIYAEEPVAIGLAANGEVVELLSSESGSWTILATRPNGVACILLGGEAWESILVREVGPAA